MSEPSPVIQLSRLDHWVLACDRFLGFVFHQPADTGFGSYPDFDACYRAHSAALMRINHAGEICAQGLYDGQSLTASTERVRQHMEQARLDETVHLAWCEGRLNELNDRISYLAPFWYLGSCVLGASVGLLGDAFSLGFVAETERQVSDHLQSHVRQLSPKDSKSIAIVQQMQMDEQTHQSMALASGGLPSLPFPLPSVMRGLAKVMTTVTYWI